jgi:asparagine synthase (glutamine-hydrolysing)
MQVALRRRLSEASVVVRPGVVVGGHEVVATDDVIVTWTGVVLRDASGALPSLVDLARALRDRPFPAVVGALEGAFAVAVYDRRDRSLWLARDATGQRAMYVAKTSHGLAFASETKALHARGDVGRTLDELSLARYLSFSYAPGEATLFREIRALPPGVAVRYDETGAERERCTLFHPTEPADLAARGDALAADPSLAHGYARTLRATLEDVVDAHLAATDSLGPPAAFLSGGIDSSLVVALAARGGRVPTCFSIAFGDDLPNELRYSGMVARHVGASHEIVTLGPDDMASALTEAAYLLDDPIGDPLTVPNALVARAASARGFRRALNGEGGDPCFGGPKNVPMLLASWYGDEPRDRAYARAYQRFFDDLPRLLTPAFRATLDGREPVEAAFGAVLDDPGITSFLNRLQTVNLLFKGAGLILPKVEKTYGAAGLVPLSPLSDRRVVANAWDTPPTLKLRGNVEKLVLKEAVRDLLPAEIVDRKKSGMLVPVHPWLSGPLAPLASDLLGPDALARRGMFEPRFVRDLRSYQGATTVRGFYGAKLWLLCTLEAWMRLFVDGGARAFEDAEPRLRPGDDETRRMLAIG